MRRRLSPKKFLLFIVALLVLIGGLLIWALSYKAKFLQQIEQVSRENLEGQLSVGDVGFTPFKHGLGITFSFYEVRLSGRRFALYHVPLLDAESVSATLDFGKLLRGQVQIQKLGVERGTVRVFRGKDGYTNASLFEKVERKLLSDSLENKGQGYFGPLERIIFRDCPVQYVDSLKNKKFVATFRRVESRLERTDSTRHFVLDGSVFFDELVFNAARGGFLRQQLAQTHLDFDYLPSRQLWRINSSTLRVDDPKVDKIVFNGHVDLAQKPGQLSLDFSVKKTDLAATLHLLPARLEKAIAKRKILPTLQADIQLRGPLNDPSPLLTIQFQTDTFRYALPYGFLRGMRAKGTFTNRLDPNAPAGDPNSRIVVSEAVGFFETIPLRGSLSVTNLKTATSVMDFSLVATPATVNALLDTNQYLVRKGSASLKFHYEGSPVEFYDPKTDRMTGKLRGKLQMNDIAFAKKRGHIDVSRLNGEVRFDENQASLPRLTMHDGRNDLTISGSVRHLPASLFGSHRPAEAFVHIDIPDWIVTWPDRLAGMRQRRSGNSKFRLTQLLDETIDNLRVTASLEAKRMQYHQLLARRIRGNVTMQDHSLELSNLSMHTCGGEVRLSGGFKTFEGKKLPVFYAKGEVKRANVESVFRSLGNFGQKAITDKNLRGILSADFTFQSRISNDTAFVKPSMRGSMNVDLEQVQILNFKPMLDIRRLVFKNRAWNDVHFAPLRTKFVLQGEEILVNRMKVQANVLYFFLDGVYSFGNKTDLSIQIPVNNLKRKAPQDQLEIREVEDVKGQILYLRAVSEGDAVRIRYDKMKRFD
ncbi:AsmA-like C-terminal region-containing protein [Persicitalea sp.]|uniref:AsmA-like C-terminal region-containing protein n=1 Tax=Persicitalea sp. TaxID=3100273 RepID=UPI003592EF27